MNGPATNPAWGDDTDPQAVSMPRAELRLVGLGIGLQYIAAICGVPADCTVRVGVEVLALSGVDGSPIRIIEPHLRFQDPEDAAVLAEVLWLPAVPRRSASDDWTWRGWLVGDNPRTPLVSVTLRSAAGTAPNTRRGTP